jgi:hypothetical protein
MVVEIQDPVGLVGYTLDVRNKIAHKYQLKPFEVRRMTATPLGMSGVAGGAGYGVGGGVTTAVRSGEFSMVPLPPNARAGASTGPDVKNEDLGEQVIEGVTAKGRRTTHTWPTGSQGNDRPFTSTNETWMSSELKEVVLTKSVDPRSGETTMKLINISRIEPSADLFFPPADYQVVDETGPFQIHWESTRK